MELPAIVTLLALLEYNFFTFRVGTSRAKYEVAAPATSGNPEWERMFRVQQNTLEQLMVFLPALWIFSTFVDPTIGAAIGDAQRRQECRRIGRYHVARIVQPVATTENPHLARCRRFADKQLRQCLFDIS